MTTDHTLREETSISPGWLWFGVVAAPLAWAVQGLFGWYFGGAGCANGALAGGSSLQLVATLIGIATAIVAAVGLGSGVRNWRRSGEPVHLAAVRGYTRDQYIAAAGTLISGIFLLAIVWAGVGGVIVNACGSAR